MTLSRIRLTEIATLTTSAVSYYANPASTKTLVKSIILYNFSASSINVTVHLVPDSSGSVGTAANGNQIFSKDLLTKESFEFAPSYPFMLIDENDTIQASASANTSANILILGDKDI